MYNSPEKKIVNDLFENVLRLDIESWEEYWKNIEDILKKHESSFQKYSEYFEFPISVYAQNSHDIWALMLTIMQIEQDMDYKDLMETAKDKGL